MMSSCVCAHCGLPVPGPAQADKDAFCCVGCAVAASLVGSDETRNAISRGMLRVGIGIFLTMNVMIFSLPLYDTSSAATPADAMLRSIFRWLVFILATPAVITLTIPLAGDALTWLRRWRVRTSFLVVTATSAAYLASVLNLLTGAPHVYFDSACMILTLVTLGGVVEASLKRRSTVEMLDGFVQLPNEVMVETEQGEELQSLDQVAAGSRVRVTTGELFAVDGEVCEGVGTVLESDLTGEALPRPIEKGSHVWAGTTLVDGMVVMRVEATGIDRRMSQIVTSLKDALGATPRIHRIAERVATVFVPVVIIASLGTLAWSALSGAWLQGAERALAVALIACPCALGFAAPLASWSAIRHLHRRGVLIRSAVALERAGTVTHVAFDKTGTLTTGAFEIEAVESARPQSEILSVAAALERASTHPIAIALRAASSPDPHVTDVKALPGRGVMGTKSGRTLSLVGASAAESVRFGEESNVVVLRIDDEPVAWIALRESIRDDAIRTVEALQQRGITMQVLTGDRSGQARHVAHILQVPVAGGMMPDDKASALQRLRESSPRPIAFVGDGINDAPALATADVAIAMQSASDLTRVSGDVVLLRDRLDLLPDLFDVGRRLRQRIKIVLIGSAAYNAIGLGLAIGGYLTPVFAATAMIVSSVLVLVATSRTYASKRGAEQRDVSSNPAQAWQVAGSAAS